MKPAISYAIIYCLEEIDDYILLVCVRESITKKKKKVWKLRCRLGHVFSSHKQYLQVVPYVSYSRGPREKSFIEAKGFQTCFINIFTRINVLLFNDSHLNLVGRIKPSQRPIYLLICYSGLYKVKRTQIKYVLQPTVVQFNGNANRPAGHRKRPRPIKRFGAAPAVMSCLVLGVYFYYISVLEIARRICLCSVWFKNIAAVYNDETRR